MTNQTNSKTYIKINFKDFNLSEFDRVKNLINKCAYDDDLYRLLPFLFRLIFEKLIYQIYLKSFDNNQKFLYFSHRPRNLSKLITLFTILKDKEFYQYHGGSINQEIITILKEVQKKGNLTVHQIIRQIDKEYRDNWKDKIERTLENLLVLYRNLPENKVIIEDIDRLEKTKRVLGILRLQSQKKLTKVKKILKQELIKEETTQLIKLFWIFSGGADYNKGILINIIRNLGKEKIEKFLNLGYSDDGSMIILRNIDWTVMIYGPTFPTKNNFEIRYNRLKENNIYRDDPEKKGNSEILNLFLDSIRENYSLHKMNIKECV